MLSPCVFLVELAKHMPINFCTMANSLASFLALSTGFDAKEIISLNSAVSKHGLTACQFSSL